MLVKRQQTAVKIWMPVITEKIRMTISLQLILTSSKVQRGSFTSLKARNSIWTQIRYLRVIENECRCVHKSLLKQSQRPNQIKQ